MRMTRLQAAAACLAAGVSLAGCSSAVNGAGSNGSAAGRPTGFPSQFSTTPGTTDNDGKRLESIALKASDLGAGYQVTLIPGGAQVSGQVTLDNCGYDFTTEADRVSRRQYGIAGRDPNVRLSNELVAYDSAAHATLAIRQWRVAARTCPATPVQSQVASEPDLTIKITRDQSSLAALPASLNVLTVESASAPKIATFYNLTILQARGRFLDAVYLDAHSAIGLAEVTMATRLAVITGRRLARLA